VFKKYKVRFVARGFSQKERVKHEETSTLFIIYAYIGPVIPIYSEIKWTIHHMDVNIAFLNGVIGEGVYIEKPQAFKVHGRESHV